MLDKIKTRFVPNLIKKQCSCCKKEKTLIDFKKEKNIYTDICLECDLYKRKPKKEKERERWKRRYEQIKNDPEKRIIYNLKQKEKMKKYHQSKKGKEARARFYLKNRNKILAQRRLKYREKKNERTHNNSQ